jgi:hypothetical protein
MRSCGPIPSLGRWISICCRLRAAGSATSGVGSRTRAPSCRDGGRARQARATGAGGVPGGRRRRLATGADRGRGARDRARHRGPEGPDRRGHHHEAAGRPREEAEAAGALLANRYAARAGWFGGALGTPEELYARTGADIRRADPARGHRKQEGRPHGRRAVGHQARTSAAMPRNGVDGKAVQGANVGEQR